VRAAFAIYLLGVVIGLARTDGRPAARVGLALAWPLGPGAFVVTVAALCLASLIAFPLFGAAAAAAAAGWALLR
jgi:hypothetical protein